MEFLFIYIAYILGILGALYLVLRTWRHVTILKERGELLKDLIKKDYEVKNIDLNNFLK